MQRLQGWDCKLIYSDPYRMPEEMEKKLNCEYVSLETLLRESDVVSLHCPLTEQTRGMIGKEQLAMMKPNAIIVNEARGAVIDDKALVEALQNGTIWGAAIDTWEKEPLDPNDPLVKMEKVITTRRPAKPSSAASASVIKTFSARSTGRNSSTASCKRCQIVLLRYSLESLLFTYNFSVLHF